MNKKFTPSIFTVLFIFCILHITVMKAEDHIKASINLNYDVLIYPNPSTNGIFFIQGDNIQTIEVTNLIGQVVYSLMKTDNVKDKFIVELNKNKSGVYLLSIVFNNNHSIQRKIIIRE